MDQMKLFGRRVREVRRAAKLTQEEVAERAGVTANFLGYVERGKKQPSLTMVFGLAKALNVSADALFRLDRVDNDEATLRKKTHALIERANADQLHLAFNFLKYVAEV